MVEKKTDGNEKHDDAKQGKRWSRSSKMENNDGEESKPVVEEATTNYGGETNGGEAEPVVKAERPKSGDSWELTGQ